MIIDSHAHYVYSWFNTDFKYVDYENGSFVIKETCREVLIEEMLKRGIIGFVEPSIGFKNINDQLALAKKNKNNMWVSVGVHPTRCIHTPWKNRKDVEKIAKKEKIVAIGETGLDYHHPRKTQKRIKQMKWFIYQIKLAHSLGLPMILHIRMADRDGLAILRFFKNKLHGGVAHCFTGDSKLAQKYIDLGFAIGIGAKLLNDDEEGKALREAVANVPISSILVETDSPYVLPDTIDREGCKKLCNTSLILPAIVERIADLRGESVKSVEEAIYQNTVRVFGLDMI